MNNRFLHPRLPGTEKGNRHNHKRFSVRGDNSPPGSVDTTRERTKKHSTRRTLWGLFDCSNGSAFDVGASLEA